jgi:hypothetical protein
MTEILDKCPSCGSEAKYELQANDHRVACTKCGMNTGWCNHSHGSSATDTWNKRTETKMAYHALVTPHGTPAHLFSVKLFDTEDELLAFWDRPEGRRLVKTHAVHLPTFKRLTLP